SQDRRDGPGTTARTCDHMHDGALVRVLTRRKSATVMPPQPQTIGCAQTPSSCSRFHTLRPRLRRRAEPKAKLPHTLWISRVSRPCGPADAPLTDARVEARMRTRGLSGEAPHAWVSNAVSDRDPSVAVGESKPCSARSLL